MRGKGETALRSEEVRPFLAEGGELTGSPLFPHMTRARLVTLALLSDLLIGVTLANSAEELAETDSRELVPIARILASPDQYGEKEVVIRGVVVKKTRAVFPNGRVYSTLAVGNGKATVTVFSWEDPLVGPGDSVEVTGIFHIWRYNFRHMIESRRITRSGSSSHRLRPH